MKSILPLVKKIFKPGLVLTVLLLALLALEGYLLYYKVYGNLTTTVDQFPITMNIVRLDVNNYNKMLEMLDGLNAYAPSNPTVENPFR